MTATTLAKPLVAVGAGCDSESKTAVWKGLSSRLVAPGRARSVKLASDSGKYSSWPVPLPAKLPSRPVAALLYDRAGRTHWLAIDLDPIASDVEGACRAAGDIAALLRRAGFHPFADRSPRGGIHLWARLPRPEPLHFVMPLMRGVKAWLLRQQHAVKFDLTPMSNVREGCLTLPASPCKGGGYRQLITPWRDALTAIETAPDPQATQRLASLVDVEPGDLLASPSEATADEDRPLVEGKRRPLPVAAMDYFTAGFSPAGTGVSEARRSALLYAAWRGWSLADLIERVESGEFAGLAEHINRRGKGGIRYLRQEWRRAARTVRACRAAPVSQPFHQSEHTHELLHGGASRHWTNLWLSSAERWAVGQFGGQRLLSVLAVLRGSAWLALLQDNEEKTEKMDTRRIERYTPGQRRELPRVAELPVRSLHLVAGLLSTETVADVLRELNEAAGSPMLLVSSGAGASRGSRYYLREVGDGGGDASTCRVEHVGPVWSELGLSSWRVYTVLVPTEGRTAAELIHQSGLGKSAVYNALRVLRDHNLVAVTEGQVYVATETSPAVVGQAIGADARYAAALERVRAERQEWKELLASWQLAAIGRAEPDPPVDVDHDVPVDRPDVDSAIVDAVLGPVAWDDLLLREPPPAAYDYLTVEDRVLELLEDMLDVRLLVPRDAVREETDHAFGRT
jgi:hypothetical protein